MKPSKTKSIKKTYEYTLPTIIFSMVLLITLINQGGFFYGAIVLAMLVSSVALFFVKPVISKRSIIFLVFSIWYFFCSVKDGFLIEYAIKGLLPMACFFMYQISSDRAYNPEVVKKVFLKFSVFVASLSVLICIVQTLTQKTFIDAIFPFQYANTAGLYFGICYVMSKDFSDKFFDKFRLIFVAALILTRSVGAIILTYPAAFILSSNKKKFLISVPIIVFAIIIFKNQVVQSYATLIERFLQINDGFVCMLKNPIFGIGAGRWENAKDVYQTGFYSSKLIHSSITAIGVSSGFVGFILFAASVLAIFYKKKNSLCNTLCVLMIIAHSILDFSLSFAAMGFVLLMFVPKEETDCICLKAKLFPAIGTAFCIFAICVLCMVSVFQKSENVEINKLKQLSAVSNGAFDRYIYELYRTNQTDEIIEAIFKKEYPSTDDILLLAKISDDKENIIKNFQKSRPFNTELRDTFKLSDNSAAFKKMSYFSKKLYKLKGENK